MGDVDQIRTPADEDAALEAALLAQLLALHPIQVTVGELIREAQLDAESFAARDSIERAIQDLSAAGLLHLNGDLIAPSRAALRFDELFS